jgi:hypothetical protein
LATAIRGHQIKDRDNGPRIHVASSHVVIGYRHKKQGTVLKFPSKANEPALQGEILSLRAHLVGNGHLTDEAFLGFLDRRAVRT